MYATSIQYLYIILIPLSHAYYFKTFLLPHPELICISSLFIYSIYLTIFHAYSTLFPLHSLCSFSTLDFYSCFSCNKYLKILLTCSGTIPASGNTLGERSLSKRFHYQWIKIIVNEILPMRKETALPCSYVNAASQLQEPYKRS